MMVIDDKIIAMYPLHMQSIVLSWYQKSLQIKDRILIESLNERANQIIGRTNNRGVRDEHVTRSSLGLSLGCRKKSVSQTIL